MVVGDGVEGYWGVVWMEYGGVGVGDVFVLGLCGDC